MLKLNTHNLWHQRLGHANSQVIKALPAHVIGGPATGVASPPTGLCNRCEKGKSKQLPFPPSKSWAETTLALVHSNLDEMSAASINRYKWTATYLNNHTCYGMMFFLKHKDEQFDAFKTYKAWAERQTGWKLKSIHTNRGGEFLSKKQKHYLQEHGIEHQTSMPYSPQQNGRAECFQQTIINKVESMRHAVGLSDGFWKHAVGTAVHIYNVTPISKAEFLTPKEMWSSSKPDISHLRFFGCVAYVHVLKGKRWKLNLRSWEMIFVGYENLSKGWQFWDAKNQCIEVSRDMKFDESWFLLRKDLDQRNPSVVEKRRSISPSQRSESTDNSHDHLVHGAMSNSNSEYPSAPVPPKIKTPPSSSSSSTNTSHRGRSPHPKYLKGTKSLRICYDGSLNASLIGYSDSDWGENKDDCHSTLGQVFTLANGVISWASQRQKMVALSVGESEYMELAATGCQCTWLRSFSMEIGFPFTQAMTICVDNQAAIFLAINPAVEQRMKHIDIHHHYIHEQVETKVIDLYHITGEENPADLFTKPLPVIKVEKFRNLIGLMQEPKLHAGTQTYK